MYKETCGSRLLKCIHKLYRVSLHKGSKIFAFKLAESIIEVQSTISTFIFLAH